jgi:16S rRNA (cytosine967-C5)-methyltransferase
LTPAARVQAAIEVLHRVLCGAPAERELTVWARGARYAGSKDRAATRDYVFDALRRLRSSAWRGGCGDRPIDSMDARKVMAGLLAESGEEVGAIFTGARHAPDPIALPDDPGPMPDGVASDLPDWTFERMRADHGAAAPRIAEALRERAPVILRANLLRTTRDDLLTWLRAEGLDASAHPASDTAIQLSGAPRGLDRTDAFAAGHFEFQDAGSQALVDHLPADGARLLDLCAGGGGKALALAARRGGLSIDVWDVAPDRMRDLPKRAARAGASLRPVDAPEARAPYDGIVVDVPCSGSGAWRRAPEARWRLTPDGLARLERVQDGLIDRAAAMLRPGGWLAYMTCSLFSSENDERAAAAAARLNLVLELTWSCTPLNGCDGFYLSVLRKGGGP